MVIIMRVYICHIKSIFHEHGYQAKYLILAFLVSINMKSCQLWSSLVCFCYREELDKKYEGKLTKEMSGLEYEIVSKLMKTLTAKKITVPGNFNRSVSHLFMFVHAYIWHCLGHTYQGVNTLMCVWLQCRGGYINQKYSMLNALATCMRHNVWISQVYHTGIFCDIFYSHSGAQCVGCSYKASSGFLYPLERGFIYVHKPPVHIRFDEVACVNFARSSGSTRSFDFDVETKSGTVYNFSSIEKWVLRSYYTCRFFVFCGNWNVGN